MRAELGCRGRREAAKAGPALEAMGKKAEEPTPGATAGDVPSAAGTRATARVQFGGVSNVGELHWRSL